MLFIEEIGFDSGKEALNEHTWAVSLSFSFSSNSTQLCSPIPNI